MAPAPIPVTVIGGYLGAGKTTLLNRLLRTASAGPAGSAGHGERLAVLVNDFGSVAVDATMIESADGTTIRLSNGCVCCSLAGGFVAAMEQVAAIEPRPDRLVVETSGVADPAAVAEYAHLPGFALETVVVLADAETIRTRAADALVGRQVRAQLAGADLVVLNKVDLLGDPATAGDGRVEDLRAWVASHAPAALVVTAVEARIDLDLLWGRAPLRRPATGTNRERSGDRRGPDHDHDHGPDHDHDHDPAHPTYVAFSVEGDRSVTRQALDDALDRALAPERDDGTAGPAIVRLKGFVELDDGGRHLVQVVGRRRRITAFTHDPGEPPVRPARPVSLVVIGLADSPSVTDAIVRGEIDQAEIDQAEIVRGEIVRRAAHDLADRLGATVVDEHH